jgi:hypothetical protein
MKLKRNKMQHITLGAFQRGCEIAVEFELSDWGEVEIDKLGIKARFNLENDWSKQKRKV